jgi:bacillithiol biosynthesis deacetylase BshB1
MAVDLLVFGPHPDDIEIGMAATVALHTAAGAAVGLCDLTRGELGSNGTPEERVQEAQAAARILGARWRVNLGWPDGGIAASPDLVRSAAALVREHRPRVVAIPYWDDRHPDHVEAARTLAKALFVSGLRRFDAGTSAEPWRAECVYHYFINDSVAPSFVVDVTKHYARKQEALACYQSQFAPAGEGFVPTRLTAASFARLIESRDAQFGARCGVAFAEGFVAREPIVRGSLLPGS